VNPEKTASPSNDPAVATAPPAGEPTLARALGLFDITMLVMGSVIGVGIFAVPHVVATKVHRPGLVLSAWAVGGLIALTGSFVYAELSRRRPHVGGQYAFLREAYHPAVAFLYGWSLLLVIQSGGIASVAVVFGEYVNDNFLHGPAQAAGWVGAAAIAVLTAVNCTGVRTGSSTQNAFMVLKILVIGTLILCGLLVADAWVAAAPRAGAPPAPALDWGVLTAFGAALVPVLFSYGGSHTTTFMAAEVRDPRRTLPRGLVLGVSGVVLLYLGVNYACLRVLGIDELAEIRAPGSEVMRRALAEPGRVFLAAGVALSALGFLSQATLTSPRVYFAMARDGLFFPAVARIHPRSRVPVVAVLLQGGFGIVIALSATFRQILDYVMSAEMSFYALTALGLFVIRRRDAAAGAPAELAGRGHPWTTLLFAAVNVALVVNMFHANGPIGGLGIGIALTGLPVYFAWHWWGRRRVRVKEKPLPESPVG
jgi:APA family basic amino acid/polyamine antiporter